MKIHNLLIAIILVSFVSCKNDAPTNTTTKEKATTVKSHAISEAKAIAIKNGYENWKDVSDIQFTFNVDRGGKTVLSRAWSWKPKTGDVSMTLNGETISYNRTKMDSTQRKTDAGFINDKFWLLAPYNLVWDEGTKITTQDTATAPIAKTKMKKLTIVYGDKGGYTPGDAYDFYYTSDFMVKEWVFRKGNAATASMTTTWEDYENYNDIIISKTHNGATPGFKLHFTDIKVVK